MLIMKMIIIISIINLVIYPVITWPTMYVEVLESLLDLKRAIVKPQRVCSTSSVQSLSHRESARPQACNR